MAKGRVIAAIDVGTTSVRTVVAEVGPTQDAPLRLIGVGVSPNTGMRKGIVVDIDSVSAAILASLEQTERFCGQEIHEVYAGVGGTHLSSLNSRGVVAIAHAERDIAPADVERAVEAARAIVMPNHRELLHVIPRNYSVDGNDGITDPVGLRGFRLEVEAHIVTGASTSIHNLAKCLERAGVELKGLVATPVACGDAILSPDERQMGVALLDFGGGTADLAIYTDGGIWHTASLPFAGNTITNDVAVVLHMPFSTAEELKVKCGSALASAVRERDSIDISAFGGEGRQSVSRVLLSQIIEARVRDTLALVQDEIERSGYEGMLSAGVVMVGGGAKLPGLKEVVSEVLGVPARLGHARDVAGLLDAAEDPSCAAAIGIARWALREAGPRPVQNNPVLTGTLNRLGGWIREFFP